MATNKKTKIDGYFFMSICNGELDVNCSGDKNIISAAFATLILDNSKDGKAVKDILAVAVGISAHELNNQKEKYSSKTAKKVAKPQPIKKVTSNKK
jgi:hypothetical protein